MRKLTLGLVAVAIAGLTIGTAFSDGPEDRKGPPRGKENRREKGEGRPERGGPGGHGHGGPPLMMALDIDKDGVLSAAEIKNAVAVLNGLDKNKDGKLTRDEIRPGGPGRPGGDRPDKDGRPDKKPGRGGPGGFDFSKRFDQLDKNSDGKLTKDEIPERMQRILERADTNEDGALSKDELKAMVERFKNRKGGRPEGKGPGEKRPEGKGKKPPKE